MPGTGMARRCWKGHFLRELDDAAVDTFLARGDGDGGGDPALLPFAGLQSYGGARSPRWVTMRPRSATGTRWSSLWPWRTGPTLRRTSRGCRPRGATPARSSRSPAASTSTPSATRGRKCPAGLRPGQAGTMTALKDRYDPENVFHLNHNIRPARSSHGDHPDLEGLDHAGERRRLPADRQPGGPAGHRGAQPGRLPRRLPAAPRPRRRGGVRHHHAVRLTGAGPRVAGEDYETAYVPPRARAVLARFDERSVHYDTLLRPHVV